MANNLFISYDLMNPGQNYEKVAAAIRSLGTASKLLLSLWYVKSNHTAEQARDAVAKAADPNDKILVIDATNNRAFPKNIDAAAWKVVLDNWNK
jgi:CTP synthase (UTP-ammonia lyase)